MFSLLVCGVRTLPNSVSSVLVVLIRPNAVLMIFKVLFDGGRISFGYGCSKRCNFSLDD